MADHDDFALALQLQAEYDEEQRATDSPVPVLLSAASEPEQAEAYSDMVPSSAGKDTSTWSLVDQRWELIDPIPDIRALFIMFNKKYFWSRLDVVEVRWSPRMTLCAGLCVYEGKGGLCSVRLSEPLLKLRPRKDTVETLLHEMIHAYLFVTDNNKDHDGHGPEFHKHMYRLNKDTGTSISVYHTFHDEVDNYRQHWWRCDGPCQKRPPYHGYVKRAMNRPPSARDPWWPDHQRTCGGTYTKVKEPEGYGVKKGKKDKEEKKKIPEKPKGNMDIRDFSTKTGASDSSKAGTSAQGGSGSVARPGTSAQGGSGSVARPGTSAQGGSGSVARPGTSAQNGGGGSGAIRIDSDDSGEEGSVRSDGIGSFPGHGKSLSASSASQGGSGGGITRRIPGVGLITSGRQPGSVPAQGDMNGDGNLIGGGRPPGAGHASTSLPGMSDSDSDSKSLLLPQKKRAKVKAGRASGGVDADAKRRALRDDSPAGTVKTIPGFFSVCSNKGGPMDAKTPEKRPRPGAFTPGRWAGKKRKSSDDSLAADRNKRAHYVTSSESDSDIDEKAPLRTAAPRPAQAPDHPLAFPAPRSGGLSGLTPPSPFPGGHRTLNSDASRQGAAAAAGGASVVHIADSDPMRECPVCGTSVPESQINVHLDQCLH